MTFQLKKQNFGELYVGLNSLKIAAESCGL